MTPQDHNYEWVPAAELRVGDRLYGRAVIVSHIELVGSCVTVSIVTDPDRRAGLPTPRYFTADYYLPVLSPRPPVGLTAEEQGMIEAAGVYLGVGIDPFAAPGPFPLGIDSWSVGFARRALPALPMGGRHDG